MGRHADFLLVGGGLASATAAETLRAEGAEGSILILSAEDVLPYHRPPLSTEFLLGTRSKTQLLILDESYYRENAVDVRLGTRAAAVDPTARTVRTENGEIVHYGKLLIATGAAVNRLDVPGAALPGSYYLRAVDQAAAIDQASRTAKRAVVIGGSFLGLEIAASLRRKKLDVTLLAQEDELLTKLDARQISEFFRQYYAEQGVEMILSDTATAFHGEDRIQAVGTAAGRTLSCDMVAVAIGVTPEIGFLEGSGVATGDGVIVDQYLQTSQPDIFAAGDVANFFDPVFNRRRRVEHWDNAVKQGRLAAKNMLGQRLPYDEVSYFFCDVFDVSFEFFGMTENAGDRIERGSLTGRSFALFYMKDDVPRALFSMGRPAPETKATEALIRYQVNTRAIEARLPDPAFLLERIPSQTVLVLQGGGALGAFECGVMRALEEAGISPDIVAGVSMGAFNGAIIAANPGHASDALEAFWNDLGIRTFDLPNETLRQLMSSWHSLIFGSPQFFRPRWLMPTLGTPTMFRWTSLYDPSPVKALLKKYVDFGRLKASPVRLLLSAVNVETAALETFDSYVDDLTADHILASGSLPPGFPWTTIDGKHYWDGGIVSNSPLDQVIERCGPAGKHVFAVDLYPSRKPLPTDLMEVIARRDEIVYSERIRNDVRTRDLVQDFRKLVVEILDQVPSGAAAQIRQRPRYIQLMGDVAPMRVVRIVREGAENEPPSRDYDFSRTSIEQRRREGYTMARQALERAEQTGRPLPEDKAHETRRMA